MLNSVQSKLRNVFSENGASLVEYAVILAFIAVIAVAFSGEFSLDPDAWDRNEAKPGNISTAIRMITYKIYFLLGTAAN